MACCTETIRCQDARRLAEQYWEVQAARLREHAKQARCREVADAYTQHLTQAGVIPYGTTAVPTPPDTW